MNHILTSIYCAEIKGGILLSYLRQPDAWYTAWHIYDRENITSGKGQYDAWDLYDRDNITSGKG